MISCVLKIIFDQMNGIEWIQGSRFELRPAKTRTEISERRVIMTPALHSPFFHFLLENLVFGGHICNNLLDITLRGKLSDEIDGVVSARAESSFDYSADAT